MLLKILLAACLASGLTAAISFVLYGRARMQEREADEKKWLRIHYTTLFILLILGIVYMFFMVETSD